MQSLNQNKSSSGFAILEVLLALGILSVVFIWIFIALQRSQRRNEAQEIVQEFNMILAASVHYHDDFSAWPTGPHTDVLHTNHYLPGDITAELKHFEPTNKYQIQLNDKSKKDESFQVSLCVANQKFADLLLPLLPYSSQNPAPKTHAKKPPASCPKMPVGAIEVISKIGINSVNRQHINFDLKYPGDIVKKPGCPAALPPHIFVTLAGFDTKGKPFSMFRLKPTDEGADWKLHLAYMDSSGVIHADNPGTGEQDLAYSGDYHHYPLIVITDCESK